MLRTTICPHVAKETRDIFYTIYLQACKRYTCLPEAVPPGQ